MPPRTLAASGARSRRAARALAGCLLPALLLGACARRRAEEIEKRLKALGYL